MASSTKECGKVLDAEDAAAENVSEVIGNDNVQGESGNEGENDCNRNTEDDNDLDEDNRDEDDEDDEEDEDEN